jgi:hypothetical protein
VFEDEAAVAWGVTPKHAVVYGADASQIGIVDAVLGDEEADIFHGLAIKRPGDQIVEVPAVRIKKICAKGVVTDLYATDADALKVYRAP